jgi:hypothetical protein
MMVLCLCAAIFAGCGQKTEEGEPTDVQVATEPEYKEGYVGDPVDENGNQGEWVVYLPEEFERPAVENIEEGDLIYNDVQGEETLGEIEIDVPEIME